VESCADDEVCTMIPSDEDELAVQASNNEDDMTVSNTVGIGACVVVNCSFKDDEYDTLTQLDAIDEDRLCNNDDDGED
jgi:hypothetical protein